MNNNIKVSFEFFPPKTPEALASLDKTAQALAKFNPNFFSVTYGAGGSTREHTLETVKLLQESTGQSIAPHLSCIGLNRAEIISALKNYQAIGVQRMVALRGDLPSGMGNSSGDFKYANELVEFIRNQTGNHFHIEVAAYPECHPQASDAHANVIHLRKKIDAGANSAITQYFFNPDAYFHFVDQCYKVGIHVPIIAGIMPITNIARLMRFSAMCGAEIPKWILKQIEVYSDDDAAIKAFGIELVYKLCSTLLKGGAPGLHFFTLNQFDATAAIVQRLNNHSS